MVAVVQYDTIEHVAMQARPYPSHLLPQEGSALALCAAAFLGHNDVVHFAEAGMRVVCVDRDAERLEEMKRLYPDDWTFACDDAWGFAERAYTLGMTWDVVSVDTFTGDMEFRSLQSLELWCSLARKFVTVTASRGSMWLIPRGWRSSLYERSSDVNWLTLEKA